MSSMDKEPISKFVDLFNTNQLPSLLNEGIMDPQILKHYLVLHDQQEGPQDMYYSSPFFHTKEDVFFNRSFMMLKLFLEKLASIFSSYLTNLFGINKHKFACEFVLVKRLKTSTAYVFSGSQLLAFPVFINVDRFPQSV